jgi:hypothetical protein
MTDHGRRSPSRSGPRLRTYESWCRVLGRVSGLFFLKGAFLQMAQAALNPAVESSIPTSRQRGLRRGYTSYHS